MVFTAFVLLIQFAIPQFLGDILRPYAALCGVPSDKQQAAFCNALLAASALASVDTMSTDNLILYGCALEVAIIACWSTVVYCQLIESYEKYTKERKYLDWLRTASIVDAASFS